MCHSVRRPRILGQSARDPAIARIVHWANKAKQAERRKRSRLRTGHRENGPLTCPVSRADFPTAFWIFSVAAVRGPPSRDRPRFVPMAWVYFFWVRARHTAAAGAPRGANAGGPARGGAEPPADRRLSPLAVTAPRRAHDGPTTGPFGTAQLQSLRCRPEVGSASHETNAGVRRFRSSPDAVALPPRIWDERPAEVLCNRLSSDQGLSWRFPASTIQPIGLAKMAAERLASLMGPLLSIVSREG